MFCTCAPTKELRRLLKKHPELLNEVRTVEVITRDTIIIDRISADTIFSATVDSIIIENGKLRIIYRRTIDSIYIRGEYLGDTLIRIDTVYVDVKIAEVREPTIWEQVRGWLWILILIVLIVVFRKALKKLFGL